MEFGLGVLHLAPDAFWRMTLREYERAVAGHNAFHGNGRGPGMSQARIAELKALYPDNPPT